jgi:hypothetical protein
MTSELSYEAKRRIADTRRRRRGRSQLKAALHRIKDPGDIAAVIRLLRPYTCDEFDTTAEKWLPEYKNSGKYQKALENLMGQSVDDILPKLTPSARIGKFRIEQRTETGVFWEVGPDGNPKRPRKAISSIFALQGEFGRLWGEPSKVCLMYPNHRPTIRSALTLALEQRVEYWVRRFDSRTSADKLSPGRRRTTVGRNIDALRKECGWTLEQLSDKTGIDIRQIERHIYQRQSAQAKSLKDYAEAFTKKLRRTVTVAELLAEPLATTANRIVTS